MSFFWGIRFWLRLIREILACIIDVSKRCLNGDIDPVIQSVDSILAKPISQTMLANSITYTPGTVTIDVNVSEKRIFVGAINPRKREEIIPLEPYVERWLGK
ncbi:MAG: Na+/H+ antiporter subunit E [Candidatus Verstraetearchaeota archaeon]|jgi:energy-converting hydrogenase B subunit A|nr:Na+/H+ antiporter subunit E [Candidatus Verstraetearchaeota archaeon]